MWKSQDSSSNTNDFHMLFNKNNLEIYGVCANCDRLLGLSADYIMKDDEYKISMDVICPEIKHKNNLQKLASEKGLETYIDTSLIKYLNVNFFDGEQRDRAG